MAVAKRFLRLPELRAVAGVREINGYDEQWIKNGDTLSAIELVDRLLLDGNSFDTLLAGSETTAIKPGQAIDLPTAERDRLLTTIYVDNFGDIISGERYCQRCEKRYEVEFKLSDLITNLDASAANARRELLDQQHLVSDEHSNLLRQHFLLKNEQHFRLPTGREELAIADRDEQEAQDYLIQACLIQASKAVDDSTLFEAAEAIAPVMDFTLDSHCAECEHPQAFHFNMQVYLLQTLLAHKKQLVPQIHKIASHYAWPLDQILNLPRSQRLAFVAMIDVE